LRRLLKPSRNPVAASSKASSAAKVFARTKLRGYAEIGYFMSSANFAERTSAVVLK
jgi:hypothetical protein